jgi:hypothetical protein
MGAILAPGRRTVSSALRAMGLDRHKRFHRYHRVLSHASCSSLYSTAVSKALRQTLRGHNLWINIAYAPVMYG